MDEEKAEIKTLMAAAEHMEKEGKLNDDERDALAQLCIKNNIDLPNYDDTSKELKKRNGPRLFAEEVSNPYRDPSDDDETAKDVGAPRAVNPEYKQRANVLYNYFDKVFKLDEKYEHQRTFVWQAAQHLALEELGLLREGSEKWLDMVKRGLEEAQTGKKKREDQEEDEGEPSSKQ